jgi:hypothetical protein
MKHKFFVRIFEKRKGQISSFIKTRPVGAELFHADRQNTTKLIITFRNFAKPAKRIPALQKTYHLLIFGFGDLAQCAR